MVFNQLACSSTCPRFTLIRVATGGPVKFGVQGLFTNALNHQEDWYLKHYIYILLYVTYITANLMTVASSQCQTTAAKPPIQLNSLVGQVGCWPVGCFHPG